MDYEVYDCLAEAPVFEGTKEQCYERLSHLGANMGYVVQEKKSNEGELF